MLGFELKNAILTLPKVIGIGWAFTIAVPNKKTINKEILNPAMVIVFVL